MKKINYIVFTLISFLLFSCSEDAEIVNNEKGYLRLNVSTDLTTNTKAYDPAVISLKIMNSAGETVKSFNDWASEQESSIELKTGQYKIMASSLNYEGNSDSRNQPYYAGDTTVVIKKDESISAKVICTLANVKVSVEYDDLFKTYFKAATMQVVEQENDENVCSFLMSDNKIGYFSAVPLKWTFSATNNKNQTNSKSGEIENVSPRDHYRFKFQIAEPGSGTINVSIDSTMNELIYTFTVPQEGPKVDLTINKISAWSNFVLLEANASSSAVELNNSKLVFKYRESNTDEWFTALPNSIIGSTLTGRINLLDPNKKYECQLVHLDEDNESNLYSSEVLEFTTEEQTILHNGTFDTWNKSSKTWYAATTDEIASGRTFWDSGNPGAAIASKNPTEGVTAPEARNGMAAKMSSQFVGVFGIGAFAAGNLYTGHFVKAIGMSGAQIEFGSAFTSRPTRLKGWYSYTSGGKCNYINNNSGQSGDPDSCSVYIALSDKSEPYLIDTSTGTFIDFDSDPNIIAYGALPASRCSSTDGWEEFVIDLEYRDLTKKPTYIIIVASASKGGDYFTGSTSSVMYLDDFELVYGNDPKLK